MPALSRLQVGLAVVFFVSASALTRADEPGDAVQWLAWPVQKRGAAGHPRTLTSILEHLPSKYGEQYSSPDPVTSGHETTHGIHSELRRHVHIGSAALYHPPGNVVVVESPRGVTLRAVAARVPVSLRGSRYQTYLVTQTKDWNDTPLYIFDEWVAYVNGALVGMETRPTGGNTDVMLGPLEFSYYALALCATTEAVNPEFVRTNAQFREFVAIEIRYSAWIWEAGSKMDGYRWDDKLRRNFVGAADARPLRELAVRWWGQEFAGKYLGVLSD